MTEGMASLRLPGFTDPGWEYGVAQDQRKKKVKCNYCGKIVSGGIYRLKQHLARISGEVTHCKKAPEEVYLKMKENLECHRASKRRQSEDEEQSFYFHSNDDDEEDQEPVGYKRRGKQRTGDQSMVVCNAPLRSLGFIDPGWEHGVAQDERKKKVKCNYCEKIVSGGINRFKQHLARIPGEVAFCKMAPEEVYLKMKENMKWHRTGRRRRSEAQELAVFYMQSDNDDELENDQSNPKRLNSDEDVPCRRIIRKSFRGRSPGSSTELQLKQMNSDSLYGGAQSLTPSKHSKIKAEFDKKSKKEVTSAICEFFYYAGIPFNAANSPYFHKMLDLVGQYGQGLRSPSARLISGRSLQDEVTTIKEYVVEIKASWSVTGCSILADTWKNLQGRTLINFLVSCPRGTYFFSTLDASDIVEDALILFKLLDNIVEEVGEENVVQVVTENTTCYKAAGKMLEEKRKHLFWTPCAAYCINQMLEDFVKIKWVLECIEKGQRITKFIYNRAWMLNLMKKEFTAGRELLKPSATRSATNFTTLQSMLEHRADLKRMFQSSKWISSQLAKSDEGIEVAKIVLNSTFWKKMQYVKKSVDPVVNILQRVDSSEGLSMPSVYNDMYRAKLSIKSIHGDDERKYSPFWSVIDDHWNSFIHHPLYVAAYFLNPSYRYCPDFMAHPEVVRGVNECITRLEPDNGRRVSAVAQISDFVFAKADFGTELATSTRMDLDPAAWWQQHGINCLVLQRIAVRILSQTCLSFRCEHNWSTFDQIHSTRNNRLARKNLDDLTYVHYNLRLRESQLKKTTNDSISHNTVLLESLLHDWIVENERPAVQGDEGILYNEMKHTETYDNEVNENDDIDAEPAKSASTGKVELLEVPPATMSAEVDDDDADVDFLDDDDFSD